MRFPINFRSLGIILLILSGPLPQAGAIQPTIQGDSPATPPAGEGMAGAARAEHTQRYLRGVRRALQALPRDRWDLQEVGATLGDDPQEALAWVVQHTGWVPYDGILRGPKGVLMDRLGNDWDRALLLAALCETQGLEVRLVCAPWTLEGLDAARPVWDWGTGDHLEEGGPHPLTHFARDAQLPAQAFQASEQRARWRSEAAQRETRARVGAVTATLLKTLNEEGAGDWAEPAPLPWPSAGDPHVWVQVARESAATTGTDPAVDPDTPADQETDSSTTWIDLDPLHRNAQAGVAWLEPVEFWSLGEVPADRYRSLRLSAVAETWRSGTPEEVTLVAVDLRTMDCVGETVQFLTTPLTSPALLREFGGQEDWSAVMQRVAAAETEWLPTFVVREQPRYEHGIRADGRVLEQPNQPAAARAAGRAAGRLNALGTGSAPKQDPDGFSALWIQVEELADGLESRPPVPAARRTIFDWSGPAARKGRGGERSKISDAMRLDRNLRMLGSSSLCITPCDVPRSFLEQLFLLRTWQQRGLWESVARGKGLPTEQLQEELRWVRPLEAPLWGFQRARLDWNQAVQSYVAAPNAVIVHQHPVIGREEPVELRSGYDVVWNRREPWSGAPAKLVRLQQGVADTVVESRLLTAWRKAPLDSLDLGTQTGRWLLLRSPQGVAALSDPWSPNVRERLLQDLGAGQWCLLPSIEGQQRPDRRLAYWRVDPATGTCLGMGGQGWGAATAQEMVETVEMIAFAVKVGVSVGQFGKCLHGAGDDRAATVCAVAFLCSASTAIFSLVVPGPIGGVAGASCSLIR